MPEITPREVDEPNNIVLDEDLPEPQAEASVVRTRDRVRAEEENGQASPAIVLDDDENETPKAKEQTSGMLLGLKSGLAGAEETLRSGGGGVDRLTPQKPPALIFCLENGPFVSFRQHWVPASALNQQGRGDRPVTCTQTEDCPLCNVGHPNSPSYCFNILHISADAPPKRRLLQIGTKAYTAWRDMATKEEKINFQRALWAVNKSGTDTSSQTNFAPVKPRDIADEWKEVQEFFDVRKLNDIVAEAQAKLYKASDVAPPADKNRLKQLAKILTESD